MLHDETTGDASKRTRAGASAEWGLPFSHRRTAEITGESIIMHAIAGALGGELPVRSATVSIPIRQYDPPSFAQRVADQLI